MSLQNYIDCTGYKSAFIYGDSHNEDLKADCIGDPVNVCGGYFMFSVCSQNTKAFTDNATALGIEFKYDATDNNTKMSLLDLTQTSQIIGSDGLVSWVV